MRAALCLLLLLIGTLAGAVASTAQAREPLVLLRVCCGMGSLDGLDRPIFALYDDGLVIFQKARRSFASIRLDKHEQNALLAEIGLTDLLGLEKRYDDDWLSVGTDQPSTILTLWIGGKRKEISVYGSMSQEGRARPYAPSAFLRAYDAIEAFQPPAAAYIPEWIEVQVGPQKGSTAEAIPWPRDWPALATAQSGPNDDGSRLSLPASEEGRLRQLLESLEPGQAIESGGHTWWVNYRLPFPNEDRWLN